MRKMRKLSPWTLKVLNFGLSLFLSFLACRVDSYFLILPCNALTNTAQWDKNVYEHISLYVSPDTSANKFYDKWLFSLSLSLALSLPTQFSVSIVGRVACGLGVWTAASVKLWVIFQRLESSFHHMPDVNLSLILPSLCLPVPSYIPWCFVRTTGYWLLHIIIGDSPLNNTDLNCLEPLIHRSFSVITSVL